MVGGIALNLGAAGAAALEISSVNDGVAAIEAAGEGRWLAAAGSGFFALPFGKFAKAGKVLKNIHGGALSADEALEAGAKWLGEGYEEIASGVFRSADNTRQFRITSGDHVNFEVIGEDGRKIIENSHVDIKDP